MFTKSILAAVIATVSLSASAADYFVVTPFPGKKAAAKDNVVVTLNSQSLPVARVSQPYAFDLGGLLQVSGDASFDPALVGWELAGGALPSGITLGADGRLSGTPTTKDLAGSNFEVLATYKTHQGQQAYLLKVEGIPPTLAVSSSRNSNAAAAPNFGARTIYSSAAVIREFYLNNLGSTGATEADLTLTGSSAFSIAEVRAVDVYGEGFGGCASVAAGAAMDCVAADAVEGFRAKKHLLVRVAFKPEAAGAASATLAFDHNGTGIASPYPLVLSGTGAVVTPTLAVSNSRASSAAPSGAFGDYTTGSSSGTIKTFYLNNLGSEGRIESDISVSGNAEFSIAAVRRVDVYGEGWGGCASVDAASAVDCFGADAADGFRAYKHFQVDVRFKPTAAGTYSGKLTFAHNGSATPTEVALSGAGVEVSPQVSVTGWGGGAVVTDFGDAAAGSSKELYVYLKNTGSQGAIKAGVEVSGDPRFSIVSVDAVTIQNDGWGGCASVSAAAASGCVAADASTGYYAKKNLRVRLRFTNNAAGPATGTLRFTHNGTGVATPVSYTLSGNGL